MRNILVFPDGSEQDFQYPVNRELITGEVLNVHMKDDSVHVMRIKDIEKKEKAIYYHLELA